MQFVCKLEFRGWTTATSRDGNFLYYLNLEDEYGESAKIFSEIDGSKFEKGKKYDFIFDYSPKYGSLKIKGVK